MQDNCIEYFKETYVLDIWEAILTNIQNFFFCEEIRTKEDLSYISICSLSIL